jgi:eukaryotic-like serine/threonine-protein kinase
VSGASATAKEQAAQTTPITESLGNRIKHHKRSLIIALSVLIVALASLTYLLYLARPANAIDSIAVLPLVNASNDPNTEYLSEGITDSIISNLSQLPQLKVMARSTVFHFKGKDTDPREVGRQLGVRAVMSGRLLQQGDHLIVRTELVNVADGTQLWGAEYDRKLSDVLALQQDISREISEKLRLRLTGEEKKRLTGHDTTNAESFQFYLRGRYFWNKRTADGIRKAVEQFQQAIERDPNYALGYVGLADCYVLLEINDIPTSEGLPKARAAADRALQIDDSLSEAHGSSAHIYEQLWRWSEAEAEYKRAISLNPNYATAHQWFAGFLRSKRQFDDALREIKRAQELDPLSSIISMNVACDYLLKNDPNSAIEQNNRIIELDPSFPRAHEHLGFAYLKQRRYEEATTEFQKTVELSGRAGTIFLSDLGYCYAVSGKRAEALQILKELEEKYAKREANAQYLASVYVGLGDKDQAFAWLEKDFEQHSGILPRITWWFSFEDLRSDPRYADLVRRMGLQP